MIERLSLDAAVARLRAGGVVAFPTETTYALGCLAGDATAVERLLASKGRPDGKPLPILVNSVELLRQHHQLESPLLHLAERFWPGPLTVVVPAFPGLVSAVTAETQMVGVRNTSHPVARALVRALGAPLVATSANRSGTPAALTADAVVAANLTDIDGVLEGDLGVMGGPSTVVGLLDGALHFFREGKVPTAMVQAAWERVRAE